ncbi:MAG: queuosine precursor transporter [Bacilli bacterium]|nr:queuosine precursor transporter [Bacilli bacterium]
MKIAKKKKRKIINEKNSETFLVISTLFIICTILSNVLCSKIISIFGMTCTAGILIFPISYIIGDVLTEVYGYKKAQRTIFYGFAFNLFATLIFLVAIKLPYPSFWENQEAFSIILGNTFRVYIASVLGYLIGGFSNSFIMHYIKNNTKIKFLWFRTIISTIIGEGLDTVIFLTISFFGIYSNNQLLLMILYQWLFKTLYETIFTPLTYLTINKIRKLEGIKNE